MNKELEKIVNRAGEFFMSFGGVSQKKTKTSNEEYSGRENSELFARAAAQGAVLLKNDGVLPLENGESVSVFGRVQINWFYTGYGSGGDVNRAYPV